MEVIVTFAFAFIFSFVGSIPPGVLNITIVQLGLQNKLNIAWRFAIAAALIEYPYAWLAIRFEDFLTASPFIDRHLQLITGLVLIVLGIVNLWSAHQSIPVVQRFQESGFRRGIVLSILNPMALPFWVGITAYLRSMNWIDLSSSIEVHAYLLGVSLGAFVLLIMMAHLAKYFLSHLQEHELLKKLPGVLLILLACYALSQYFG